MPLVFPRLAVLFVVDEDEAKRIHFFDEFAVSIEIPSLVRKSSAREIMTCVFKIRASLVTLIH